MTSQWSGRARPALARDADGFLLTGSDLHPDGQACAVLDDRLGHTVRRNNGYESR
jgi:hypothetical protein